MKSTNSQKFVEKPLIVKVMGWSQLDPHLAGSSVKSGLALGV